MESELNRVVDVLPGLVWTALPDGSLDFVNAQWREYTGHSERDAHTHGWQSTIHPQDLPALIRLGESALLSGEPGEMQARLHRSDGAYRRFVVHVRPLADAGGKITTWLGIGTDIENYLQVDNVPGMRDADLYAIVDSIPAFMGLATPTGGPEYFNRHALNYLGVTGDDLQGDKAIETLHPDDLPSALAHWERAVETGEPYEFIHRVRRADGIYRWFDVRGLPLRDNENRIVRWFIVDADIDDKRRNEILLSGENRLLEMVMRGESDTEILLALCQLAEDTIGDCHASVMLADASGTRLEEVIAPHLPASFIDAHRGMPIHVDAGPCPMAMSLKQQIVAADLSMETRWAAAKWPAKAMSHGVRACWAMPIVDRSDTAVGALAIYADKPRSPTSHDLVLIQRLCHMASINIERQHAQQSLAQALDEIRRSEDRLRATIDTVPGFVWRAGTDGNVEFLNQRWCDFTGMSLAASLGIGWTSAIHPADAPALGGYWQALLEAGQPGAFEARLRRHDGTCRWFLIRAVPLLDEAGHVVKWYGQNTDIEDRKRTEMLLEGEKHLLGMMAGGTPLPQVLISLCELVQASISGALCSVVLIDPRRTRSLQEPSMRLRLQPGAAPDVPDALLEETDGRPLDPETSPIGLSATREEPVLSMNLANEHRWNAWRSAALSHGIRANWSTPINSSCGTVLGIFSILFREPNATEPAHHNVIAQFTHLASIAIERSRSEAALRQSQAFMTKAQRLSQTGTFSWRVATDEIVWSEEVYRILELDPAVTPTFELLNTRIHPEDRPAHGEMIRRQRNAAGDFEHEHRLLLPDGSVKYLYLVAHATRDSEGNVEYIAALQDITQRRLSEEALGKVRSELAHVARVASLGALTASIAHEVNQPLAGIITNASTCLRMLGAEPPNIDGARETARRMIRDGNRASEVINRLRALFAKRSVATEKVDLNEAAREVIAMLLGDLQRKGVILHPEFADDLPLIRGDRVQLQQVILNLIMNASDAMDGVTDRPRHMRVSTHRDTDESVRLAVSDDGIGFDPQEAQRLFHAFYTTKNSGMGIGLSVSRSIIEGHEGRLWATPNEGHGATFAFSLPCLSGGEAGTTQENAAQPTPRDVGHALEGT